MKIYCNSITYDRVNAPNRNCHPKIPFFSAEAKTGRQSLTSPLSAEVPGQDGSCGLPQPAAITSLANNLFLSHHGEKAHQLHPADPDPDDCTDYHAFDAPEEQELTFCLPLLRRINRKNILFIPRDKTAAIHPNMPITKYSDLIREIDDIFVVHRFRQDGVMCVTCDTGSYPGTPPWRQIYS